MRRVILPIALALALLAPVAHGSTAIHWTRLERALDGWRIDEARDALAALEHAKVVSPRLELARGRLQFLSGEYGRAARTLEGALETGSLARHLLALAVATEAETRSYLRHETRDGHFVISYEPGRDALMVPYLEEVLERAFDALTARIGFVPGEKIRVEIYPRVDVLGAVSPLTVEEIRTTGTIALCKYNRLMITSPRDLVYGYPWADTAAHELVHLLITQRTYNQVPIWLHEGLAKYLETSWRDGERPRLERRSEDRLARALSSRSLISFEAMSPSMAKLPSQDAAATAFAEVFTVIDWMVETHGVESVGKLLEAMAKGSTDRKAIEAVTGMSFSKFERAWRRYLGEARLRRLDQAFDTRLLFRGYDTQATELEMIEAEDARRWIWLGDQLQIQRRPLAALKEYEKAAQIVGDAVPMIQAKIGRMHLELGQLQQAKESLEGALSVAPDYVLLPLLLGRIAALEGEHLSARSHLEHALRLNPFDVHLHGALAGTYDALSEEALAARERRAQSSLHDAMRDPGDRP